jgi:hypothetical protein
VLNDPTPVAFAQLRKSIDELGVFLYSQKLASSKLACYEDDDERRRHHRRVVSSITTAHFSPRRSARGSEGRACTRNTQLARRSLVKRNESGVE